MEPQHPQQLSLKQDSNKIFILCLSRALEDWQKEKVSKYLGAK